MNPRSTMAQAPSSAHQNASSSLHTPSFSAPSQTARLELDPGQPLFFPFHSSAGAKGRTKDLFDVARDKGWYWRDPAVGFYRTDTQEDIKKWWESEKMELTREWKKRSREAGKVRKRRGGDDGAC
jgi:hypothetical protein